MVVIVSDGCVGDFAHQGLAVLTSYLGRRSRGELHIFSHDLPSHIAEFIILEVLLTSFISAVSSKLSLNFTQLPTSKHP